MQYKRYFNVIESNHISSVLGTEKSRNSLAFKSCGIFIVFCLHILKNLRFHHLFNRIGLNLFRLFNKHSSKVMNYLTIEQSISLLPSEFKNIVKCPGRRSIYSSSMGNFYFSGSKDYGYKHKTWWYSIDPEVIKSERIAFIVLAADVKGIFLIPSSVFFAYRDRHPVGAVKGGREDFTILTEGNRYIRREAKCNDEDITRYFISII